MLEFVPFLLLINIFSSSPKVYGHFSLVTIQKLSNIV